MNKPKFKVGDVLKIKQGAIDNNVCPSACIVDGTHVKITKIYDSGNYEYDILRDGKKVERCFVCLGDKDLELVRAEKRLEYGYCTIGDIIVNEDGDECMILDVRERLVAVSYCGDFTAYVCFYTYEELQREGWKIKQPEEDIVELTREEIAQLKGISVDKLRIKE